MPSPSHVKETSKFQRDNLFGLFASFKSYVSSLSCQVIKTDEAMSNQEAEETADVCNERCEAILDVLPSDCVVPAWVEEL